MTEKVISYIKSQRQHVDCWWLCDFYCDGTIYEITFHNPDFQLEEVYTLQFDGRYWYRDRLLNYSESKELYERFLLEM